MRILYETIQLHPPIISNEEYKQFIIYKHPNKVFFLNLFTTSDELQQKEFKISTYLI